jgi:hypothetical protein
MTTLGAVLRELVRLFVDDGAFALQIVAVVVLAAIAANLMPETLSVAGVILLFGCSGVLLANVIRAGRRSAES